ncbi:MAG: RecX family transcriptional regulator [Acetobacteraceae bacterium]|nr:RecX family transcriptional regulator [Acetobacteraceae bacterium]
MAHRPASRINHPAGDSVGARPVGPPPDETSLRDAALAHLARYAATEAGLRRVLQRRIERWARAAEVGADRETVAELAATASAIAGAVVARLAAAGAVSDAEFAASRARSLTRAGRSRRAIAAHLAAKGVDTELARSAAPDDPDTELAAALSLARRRRIGPFRAADTADEAVHRKELGILARAGFVQALAAQALAMDPAEAEDRVLALRR